MLIEDKEPLVSVIMPCYNVADFIEKAIESIFNQTYKNIELVCVDDGSTDNTAEIIKKYIGKYNIRIIQQLNKGILEARRTAINNAYGDYITLVDADDWIEDTAIEKSIILINTKNSDAVVWEFYETDGITIIPSLVYKNNSDIISGIDAFKSSIDKWELTGIGLFKKELYIKAYNSFDREPFISNNSDEFITRMVFYNAGNIVKAKIKYFYYKNVQSSTRSFRKSFSTILITDFHLKKFIIDNEMYEYLQNKIINKYVNNLNVLTYLLIKNYTKLNKDERKEYIEICRKGLKDNTIKEYVNFYFCKNKIKNKIYFSVFSIILLMVR
ncbi:glycosyltransferase family 2 protein [Photobacterium carnosum]|uniref:glycosyltransferase family 2 protein n=1 Tax=Photobacterium carnosum TaxID=2023717 RepID=UPI00128DB30C|nr:glycosyltransferase family 2 protein [Photobacterium carnosum]KAE8177957.1 hypothetical protein CIT27_04240 [Photobacterium carnosum]